MVEKVAVDDDGLRRIVEVVLVGMMGKKVSGTFFTTRPPPGSVFFGFLMYVGIGLISRAKIS